MLPMILKKLDTRYRDDGEWQQYLNSIGDFANTIDLDFLSSICLEHFDRFNRNFPRFDVHNHKIERVALSADQIYSDVRYDDNKPLDFWYFQVDDYLSGASTLNYPQLKHCIEHKQWTFCPVIVEHGFGCEFGGRRLGSPFHLIEGTHRVSFINRLLELGDIAGDSLHEFITIKP